MMLWPGFSTWVAARCSQKLTLRRCSGLSPFTPRTLGMRWQGSLFVDTVLPFGLRSAPKVFTAVADALEWCYLQVGVSYSQHYLDDFLTMGPPAKDRCAMNLGLIHTECSRLGVPIKEEKVKGPTTSPSFLGIVLDMERMELRLPPPKLTRIKELLTQWPQAQRRPKRDLHVLFSIGHLAHTCKVISPGRIFLWRMIDLAAKVKDWIIGSIWMLASAPTWPGGHALLTLGTAAASWRCLPLAVCPTYHLHLILWEAGGLAVIGITSHGMASGGLSASQSRRCCR